MTDVTGPISTLPGARHSSPAGAKCDNHPDRPAIGRIQGETDSFGSEMHDLCAKCMEEMVAAERDTSGRCDWCKTEQPQLTPTRDYDEGTCGPVYYVCRGCRKDYFAQLRAEMED